MALEVWIDFEKVCIGITFTGGAAECKYAMLQTNGLSVRLREI